MEVIKYCFGFAHPLKSAILKFSKVAENGWKMVKKTHKNRHFSVFWCQSDFGYYFFSISAWQNHPIDCWWIKKWWFSIFKIFQKINKKNKFEPLSRIKIGYQNLLNNVCSEKNDTKRNSVLLLHLVLFFSEQTLQQQLCYVKT